MVNKNESNTGCDIRDAESAPQSAIRNPHSAFRIPQSNAPATILVVDDEENSRKLLEAMLVAEGLAVLTAASGEKVLDTVVIRPPDLILLDIMLPGIDGFEVTRRLKADPRTHPIPVILITSLEDRESRLKGLEAGAEEFLSKPVDRAELLVRARNLLKLKEYHDFLASHNRTLEEQVKARTAELLASEEKFRRITESALDAIIMMGADRRISFWNAAAAQIFGYTAAEAMGQELHTLIAPAAAHAKFSRSFPHFQETGEGPIISKVRELAALRKGGEEFPVELAVSAIRFDAQWHAIGIVRDITERKRVELELAEQLDELRRWQKIMLGREMRTIEVMHEVNELLARAGQPPRYPSAE